jgi:pimeloyl-ACP methyl ester carboxylesterase
MMRRFLIGLGVVAGLVLCVAAGAYLARTPERATLDDAARAQAPGKFVGSSVGTTHYEVAGPDTGRVAVLVHGFSVPMYIWDSTFVALANAGYRVIRYDLLGRGWSERADVAYDGQTFRTQLGELIDSLGVTGPVDLFGLSFGGFVTADFTAARPARVRTLVLVDPTVSASRVEGVQRWPIIGRYLFEVLAAPGMADGQPGDFLHPEQFPGWADRYRPQQRYRGFARALHRSRFEMSFEDFNEIHTRIARSGTPVLLVWGRQDTVIPIAQAEEVRGRIPALEFVPVDSAGHLPHLEQTAVVNAAVLAFLAKHPPAAR